MSSAVFGSTPKTTGNPGAIDVGVATDEVANLGLLKIHEFYADDVIIGDEEEFFT